MGVLVFIFKVDIDWLILWNMSYHGLARISRGAGDVADVIRHAGVNYMQAQDPQFNLKHSLSEWNFEWKLKAQDVA